MVALTSRCKIGGRSACAAPSARHTSCATNAPSPGGGGPSGAIALQQRPQIAAVDQLHDDGVLAARFDDVEHLRDVRVRQLRRQPRLVEQRRAQLVVGEPLGQEPLERDRAREPVRAAMHGAPDFGASAAAEPRRKLELAEHSTAHRVEYSTGRMVGRLIVLLLARREHASRTRLPSQEELARSHFVAGEEEYARGRWRDALHEFQLGYALSPRPEFLINFAQVYRKLGDYDAAARECQRYLATAPPSELAAQAQKLLGQIQRRAGQGSAIDDDDAAGRRAFADEAARVSAAASRRRPSSRRRRLRRRKRGASGSRRSSSAASSSPAPP